MKQSKLQFESIQTGEARPLGQMSNLIWIEIDQHDLNVCLRRIDRVELSVWFVACEVRRLTGAYVPKRNRYLSWCYWRNTLKQTDIGIKDYHQLGEGLLSSYTTEFLEVSLWKV